MTQNLNHSKVDAPVEGIPYQVSLRNTLNMHFCGGSIVNGENYTKFF
jgi:hypothetical protein